jgi:hypothetical protein
MAKNHNSLTLESIKSNKDRSCVKSHENSGPHHCLSCRNLVFDHIVHINICNVAPMLTTLNFDHIVHTIYNVVITLVTFDFNHIVHTISNTDI